MGTPKYFISCDWGTTNFRLRVVETATLKVLSTHSSDQGIKVLNDRYLSNQQTSRVEYYSSYLKSQVDCLPHEYRNSLILVTGMASSSIGLCEVDYADMPFDQEGKGLKWKELSSNGLDMLLISGVKTKEGMMRGEETQAIGLAERLGAHQSSILLLPGTHSKHLTWESGSFTGMKNFMTGEMFEVMRKHSILSNSVKPGPLNQQAMQAFKEGIELGVNQPTTANLMSIRARDVVQNSSKEINFYLLSGMLIGDELSYLKSSDHQILLAADDQILVFYQMALASLIDSRQIKSFEGQELEQALLSGQRKILYLNEA